MGRASRDKGLKVERELIARHAEIGVFAERVPLSGAQRYKGNGSDLDVYPWGKEGPPLVCESKARASGEGFKLLESWLADADVLFLRRDRKPPMIVLPWETYARLLRK